MTVSNSSTKLQTWPVSLAAIAEAAWEAAGFQSFLCDGQLREIIGNLVEQRADFTRADLERAIVFYWRHDAFIAIDCDVE